MSNKQLDGLDSNNNICELASSKDQSRDMESYNTQFDTYKGMLFMFLSCILKSIFAFLCKLVLEHNSELTSFHLLTYKVYIMIGIGAILLLGLNHWSPQSVDEIITLSQGNLIQLIIRSVLSVISGSLTILSLKYMAISDVYAIYYLYPGIVIILSYSLLKEKVEAFDLICLFVCFIGVICVIKPSLFINDANTIIGISGIYILFVFLAAVFKAIEDILVRNIGKQVHYFSIPIIYTIVGVILFPFPMFFFTENHSVYCHMSNSDILLLILLAIVSFTYHTLLAMSIQNENVGRASMINYFQVLFMFISDIYVFNRKVTLLDSIGIGVIFSFNFSNGLLKVYKRNMYLNQKKEQTELNNKNN